MIYCDSYEAEMLRKMIDAKKKYLTAIKNEYSYRQTQKDILFLENDILPIILRNTNVIHSEFGKFAVRGFDTALKFHCNGFLLYQPVDENYVDQPVVGVLNPRDYLPFGSVGAVSICIDNMDGMGVKVKPFNLSLNYLL